MEVPSCHSGLHNPVYTLPVGKTDCQTFGFLSESMVKVSQKSARTNGKRALPLVREALRSEESWILFVCYDDLSQADRGRLT